MKTCTKCLVIKDLSDFPVRNKRTGRLHTNCFLCIKKAARQWAENNRARKSKYAQEYYRKNEGATRRQKTWGSRHLGIRDWLIALKSNPCFDCGKSFHFSVMDLDHVRGTKLFAISSMHGRAISDDDFLSEIQKCDLVCSNCHRLRTWRRNNPEDT